MKFCNISCGIFYHFITFNDISTFQSHHLSRRQAKIFFRRVLHKIFPLYIDLFAERNFSMHHYSGSSGLFSRSAVTLLLPQFLIPISDNHFYRIKHHHSSQCYFIQIFSNTKFKQAHINNIFSFCNSNPDHKIHGCFQVYILVDADH